MKLRRYDTRCFTSDLLAAAVDGSLSVEREQRFLLGDRWQPRAVAQFLLAGGPGRRPLSGARARRPDVSEHTLEV